MSLLPYDINSYILDNVSYTNLTIEPNVGSADRTPPFMTYQYLPAKVHIEKYYQRKDIIIYTLFDTDVSRLYALSAELIELLNLADGAQGQIDSDDNRVLWVEWRGGTSFPPIDRDGFHRETFEIWVGYVPL